MPFIYWIWKAAEVLPPSFFILLERPDCAELVSLAMTLKRGQGEGERLLKLNPAFYRELKNQMEDEERIKGTVFTK